MLLMTFAISCRSTGLAAEAQVKPGMIFELKRKGSIQSVDEFDVSETLVYKISATGTNVFSVGQLPISQRFIFTLRDSHGAEVPKTRVGRESSPEDYAPVSTRRLRWTTVASDSSIAKELFKIQDYFDIQRPGTYELQIKLRLWVKRADSSYGLVISRPLVVKIVKR